MFAEYNMYGQLTTKNTFLDLPSTIGFDEDLAISGSSARRSSSSPPSYSTCRLKTAPFQLYDDAASTTTDDASANSGTDDRFSSCSEQQDLAELMQTMPLKEPMQAELVCMRPSWSDLQDESESEVQAPVQELTGPKTAGLVIPESKQSTPPVALEIPVPFAPEGPKARRCREARRIEKPGRRHQEAQIQKQEFVPAIHKLAQPTSMEAQTVICYFHNRHLHNPESYAACSKGESCNFCHEMHPLIKRRNCRITGFCTCKKC